MTDTYLTDLAKSLEGASCSCCEKPLVQHGTLSRLVAVVLSRFKDLGEFHLPDSSLPKPIRLTDVPYVCSIACAEKVCGTWERRSEDVVRKMRENMKRDGYVAVSCDGATIDVLRILHGPTR